MIKPELEEIFGEVTKNRWNNHRAPYSKLMEAILTDMDAIHVWMSLPEHVLQVADLFWYRPPKAKGDIYSRMDIEDEFCLSRSHHDYFPESPYQTPIYWLLQSDLERTIDFILGFTNKTTECFAHSPLAKNEIEEVDVYVEERTFVKQYICDRLWCSYRGTQVSTHLLSSIHMALEKFFLDNGKDADSKVLESWLLYLLRNSRSASISAVVTSIVLAYSEKTFNVAKVLFQTKDFFHFDINRWVLDRSQKNSLILLRDGFRGANNNNSIHQEATITACDDSHRKKCLEHLALSYQIFKPEGVSEDDVKERQQALWAIFDKYYNQLPDESKETEADKTWRLFLARMDRRKMKVTAETKEGGIEVSFNPEIDPKLKEYSETSLKKSSESMKYVPLKLWANYKRDKDELYKQYEQYENNPQLALEETKEIIDRLKEGADEQCRLFNGAIPADVCSILLIEHFNQLSKEEREYCKDIILEYSTIPLMPHYRYQISDGTTSAISALPIVFQNYPSERKNIKLILLLALFDDYPVDMGGGAYSIFPSRAIHKLWDDHFDDMQSLLIGYLMLKPKYEGLREKFRQEGYKNGVHEIDKQKLNENFFSEHELAIQNIIDNTISIDDLKEVSQTDLSILNTGFQLIPMKTTDAAHKQLMLSIIGTFSTSLLSHDRENKVDYSVRHAFLEKFAYSVLNAPEQDIPDYLKPFIDGFNASEAIADLFKEFISAEDKLDSYDKFWQVWNLFFEKIVALCLEGRRTVYVDKIIKSYLFAQTSWKDSATDWHTFKDSNSRFFAEIAKNIGHCPSTMYSLARSLNNVASRYLNPGIAWLSGILARNKELWSAKLEDNTVYYLESLVRKYIYTERERVRRTKQLKEEVLVILEFLVEKGSVVGYMSRENIL